MKRINLLIVFLFMTLYGWCYDIQVGQLYYKVYDYGYSLGKWAEVVNPANSASPSYYGYTKPTGIVTIPDSIIYNNQKIKVSWIGERAFEACSGITQVVLNNQIVISNYAFKNCTSLTKVTGMEEICQLFEGAFYGCSSLHSATIGSSLAAVNGNDIPSFTFYGCSSLDTIFMLKQNPPSLGTNAIPSGVIIMLSGCSYDDFYNSSIWYIHRPYLRDPEIYFPFNAYTNDSTQGVVMVHSLRGNIIRCDSTIIIQAYPLYGHRFVGWDNGVIDNPYTIHMVSDSTIVAYFARDTFSVSVSANYTERGSVTVSDTLVAFLDSVDMSAVANYGYRFDHWLDYDSVYYTYYGYPQYVNQDISDTNATRRICITHRRYCVAVFTPMQYQLSVNVDSSAYGHVSGGGVYDYLSERTIMASPNNGYHFVQWNDGVTESYRTITLTQDTSFTAYFSPNQYTISLLRNDSTMGSVTGGGQYYYHDTATLTAIPAEHYHFLKWTELGYDGNTYNLSTNNPYSHIVTNNRLFVANFAIDTHTVTAVSSDIARGMVEATGTEFEYGKPCTLTATAYTGYTFAGWSNGVTANPYTFAVLSDVSLTAIFVSEGEETYTVTVESADPTMGTVSGGGQALSGGQVEIHAIPNAGYRFLRWNDNDTNADRTITVTANATYTAYFASLNGIGDTPEASLNIYVQNGKIVVEGAENKRIHVFDIVGRPVKNHSLPAGVYLVKVGNYQARKVVVIR